MLQFGYPMPLAPTAMAFVLLACWGVPASALESAPVTSARATAALVSDTDTVAPGTPFRIGLRLRLAPGWHTYWQNPGDAGVPPQLDLDLPPGAYMMVAAHTNDLTHAAACGLRTAHVARPNERGEAAPGKPVDIAVAGLPGPPSRPASLR